jgi:hypothetical protein
MPIYVFSNVSILSDFQWIIDFNAEISNSAFQLGMTKQELYGTQIFRLSDNQCDFRPTQSMGDIGGAVQSD